jgi:hypothetical protein
MPMLPSESVASTSQWSLKLAIIIHPLNVELLLMMMICISRIGVSRHTFSVNWNVPAQML